MAAYRVGEISALIKQMKGKKRSKKGKEKNLFEENPVYTPFGEFVKKADILQQQKKGKSKFIKRAIKKVTWKNPVVEIENKKTMANKAAVPTDQIEGHQESIQIKQGKKKKRKFSEGVVEIVDMNSNLSKKKDQVENADIQKTKKIKTDLQHHSHLVKKEQKMKISFAVKDCALEKEIGMENSRAQESQPKFGGEKKSNAAHNMIKNVQNFQKFTNNVFVTSPIHQKGIDSSVQSEIMQKNKVKKKAKKPKLKIPPEIFHVESTDGIQLLNMISAGKKNKSLNAKTNEFLTFPINHKGNTESETSVLHKNSFDAKASKKAKKLKLQHARKAHLKYTAHNLASSNENNTETENFKLHTSYENSSLKNSNDEMKFNKEKDENDFSSEVVDNANSIKEINVLRRDKSIKKHKLKKKQQSMSDTAKSNYEKKDSSDLISKDPSEDIEVHTEDEILPSENKKNWRRKIFNFKDGKINKRHDSNEAEKGGDYIKVSNRRLRGFEGREDTPERLARTLYVGNLPTDFNKKNLKILFRPFGEVETIRLRSAVPTKPTIPKKVAVIKQEFHSDRSSISAYIVFRKTEDAHKALDLNGCMVSHRHLRVDLLTEDKKHDNKRSVFVGNLPFTVEEEHLWAVFSQCGKIEGIRIVRDYETGICKGFGFVLFEREDAVNLALGLEGTLIQDRNIRVQISKGMEKVETKKNDFLKKFQKNPKQQKKYGGIEFQGKKNMGFIKRNKGSKKLKHARKRSNLKKTAAILKSVKANQNSVKFAKG